MLTQFDRPWEQSSVNFIQAPKRLLLRSYRYHDIDMITCVELDKNLAY